MCRGFKYDGVGSDHTGWKKSTFLYVLKHTHKLFDEIRLTQGVEGTHDDPTSPYSTALFGNALARIFATKVPVNTFPIIFLSLGSRQREFYLKYIPFHPTHYFKKKTQEEVRAEADRVEESQWLTHQYLKGTKDTLFKSYLCGTARASGNLADCPNILQFLIIKSLIFAYIDLLNKSPIVIKRHGRDVWTNGQNSDFAALRTHAHSEVPVYTNGRDFFLSDFCFFEMFRENANKIAANSTFKLFMIEELLLIDDDELRVRQLAEKAPVVYRYLCHVVTLSERDSKFANIRKLIKSRIEEDYTTKFDIPLFMTSTWEKLDWLNDMGHGEFRHGVTPYCVQFSFLTGIATKKMLITCYNIRRQFNQLRKEIADSKNRKDLPSVTKLKVNACTKFCRLVKYLQNDLNPQYLHLFQSYLNDPRTKIHNQLSNKDFR